MPRAGQRIEHPIFGEEILFIETIGETGGKYAVRERTVLPGFPHERRAHAHLTLTETFEILEGSGRYRLGDEEKDISAGESVVMPPRLPHVHPWNTGEGPLRMWQLVSVQSADLAGAMAVEDYLVTTFGLARDGRLKGNGSPPLLQAAVSFRAMLPHAYLAGVPLPLQRLLFGLLGRLGEARGYRPRYARYDD